MTHDRHDPITAALTGSGKKVCVIPDDIGSYELGLIARLAAAGNMVSIGKFCDSCTHSEIETINQAGLDQSQWRLMTYLAEGHSNKYIARAENTTEAAIKARLRVLMVRLGVSNRTQAAVMAARAGLRQPQSPQTMLQIIRNAA